LPWPSARLAFLRNGREAVIGGNEDVGAVGETKLAQGIAQPLEIIVAFLIAAREVGR